MNKKLRIINICVNSLIVVLAIVAVFLMFFGNDGILSSSRWKAFRYFTVQSNLFMAITSAISLYYLIFKLEKYLTWLTITKLVATSGVAVTFLTVLFYLTPLLGSQAGQLYLHANLFMHVLIPVIAIVLTTMLEPKKEYRFLMNLYSMLPVTIYGIIYLSCVAAFDDYGNVDGWAWYAFGKYGLGIGALCLGMIIAMSFGLSVAMYIIQKKTKIKSIHE